MTAIILAAGRGTRMRSDNPKVLHRMLGRPIISYIIDFLNEAGVKDAVVVTGYGAGQLKDMLGNDAKAVIQKRLLGSGHAVMSAVKALARGQKDVLVICGDTPLIRASTIKEMVARHRSSGVSATVLTARLTDPSGYGRILRSGSGRIIKIMEEEEAHSHGQVVNEVNVGTYCFKKDALFDALKGIRPDNKKKEYLLTDVIEILHKRGAVIESVLVKDTDEMIGINTRRDLAFAVKTLKNRILDELMLGGVTIEDPSSVTIYPGVKIGHDTIIYANTYIESCVEIGKDCRIGPFTRLRKDTHIGDRSEIGNFVELVRTRVGVDTKIKHHTYLGDAIVGKHVNIGAGVITANYDGKNKNRTVIEDGAFIEIGRASCRERV